MRGLRNWMKMAIVLGALGAAAEPANAQVYCAARDAVVEKLTSSYGEGLSGFGVQSTAQVIEIWAAPSTGTWTVLMTLANGNACIIASGTDWQDLEPEPMSMGVPG